jgi:5-hydroxyisourate hydrolase-like protein (transthyretin family)
VSVVHGQTATLTAKVVDGYGNPIKGVKVEYSRISSVGRQTVLGISTTNDNGVSELKYSVSDALTEGVYDIIAGVEESEYYMGGNATAKLTVAKKPVIVGGKNYTVYYGSTVKYKVRIYDLSGKVVGAGKLVKFTINKKTKTAKTDKNGYATYSVKLGVGKYTITAEHNGFKASNKITFKATLSAKNVSKKKSKVTKFSVKLVNKNGKILKNKKITFKLKNKKYTAKTNKKGVATLSIKNLAVGKYTITSSYGGCTIKNTIQIKK